jgi:ribonucleases P/MRP protein subunit RPP40
MCLLAFTRVSSDPCYKTSVPVWNPYMVKHVKQLEAVQRRATKLVRGISQLSYNERLQALKLPTLQYRRKRGDMITTYKLFHGLIDADPSKFFKLNDNKTRGHKFKIVLNKCRLDVRKNFYSQRIIKEWNCLPASIVEAKDVIHFEKLFDSLHGDSKFVFNLT